MALLSLHLQSDIYADTHRRSATVQFLLVSARYDDNYLALRFKELTTLIDAGRGQDAMRVASDIALNRPDTRFSSMAVVEAYTAARSFGAGIELLQQVRTKVPTLSHPWRGMSELALKMDDRPAAARYLRKAFDLEPNVPENYVVLGDFHWHPYVNGGASFQKGIPAAGRAVGAYRKALELMPREHIRRAQEVRRRMTAISEQFQMGLLLKYMEDPLSF